MIYSLIWYLAWPVLIIVAYGIIRYALSRYEKTFKE